MPGLWSKIKTFITDEVLTSADFNAELDNVIAKQEPIYFDDYSSDLTTQRIQTAPSEGVLPTNLAGEIARLRYMLALITGQTYWYTAPAANISALSTSITQLGTLPDNRIISGRKDANNQPMFLVPKAATAKVTLKGATTPFACSINGSSVAVATDVDSGSLSLGPSSNHTATINDADLDGSVHTKQFGSYDVLIDSSTSVTEARRPRKMTITSAGTAITAKTSQICAFKVVNAGSAVEYFLARVESSTVLTQCMRGFFFDSSDNSIPAVTLTNSRTVTLMSLGWVFLSSAGALSACYTNPIWSGTQPTSASSGDKWFDMSVNKWKAYDGAAWNIDSTILVGLAVLDSTGIVAARSIDITSAINFSNTLDFTLSSSVASSKNPLGLASVYGNTHSHRGGMNWTPSDLESGTSITSGEPLYAYLSDTGKPKVSPIHPMNRVGDLGGWYHPSKPWRCVGVGTADATCFGYLRALGQHPKESRRPALGGSLGFTTYTFPTEASKTYKIIGQGKRIAIWSTGGLFGGSNTVAFYEAWTGAASGHRDSLVHITLGGTKVLSFNDRYYNNAASTVVMARRPHFYYETTAVLEAGVEYSLVVASDFANSNFTTLDFAGNGTGPAVGIYWKEIQDY